MSDRVFYRLAKDGIRLAETQIRREPPWPDPAAGWLEAADAHECVSLASPERMLRLAGVFVEKPRARLIADRGVMRPNGRDEANVRIEGLASKTDVPIRVGAQVQTVKAGDRVTITAPDEPMRVRVSIESPYILSDPIFIDVMEGE